jgi:hypothetical protein
VYKLYRVSLNIRSSPKLVLLLLLLSSSSSSSLMLIKSTADIKHSWTVNHQSLWAGVKRGQTQRTKQEKASLKLENRKHKEIRKK